MTPKDEDDVAVEPPLEDDAARPPVDFLSRLLQIAGLTLTVLAFLLPLAGYGVRWIAFALSPAVPAALAGASSIPELAVTGFDALILPVVSLVIVLFTMRAIAPGLLGGKELVPRLRALARGLKASKSLGRQHERKIVQIDAWLRADSISAAEADRIGAEVRALGASVEAERRRLEEQGIELDALGAEVEAVEQTIPAWLRRILNLRLGPRWVGTVVRALYLGLLLVWVAVTTFPISHLSLGASLLAVVVLRRTIFARGEFQLLSAWPIAVLLVAAGTVGAGINPTFGGPAARYTFTDETELAPGVYAQVGGGDGILHLESCASPAAVVIVPVSRVAHALYTTGPTSRLRDRPSILALVTRQPVGFGYRPFCPLT